MSSVKLKKIEIYKEEITELYEDSVRSDGFDAEYFNEKISGHYEAAKIDDSVDLVELKEMIKDITEKHWNEIRINTKKAA